ncbi:MAG TPA: prepilin-type N-terminal cleavage/methylation domain-containing protein [Candidatus Limnocylindria bacterium]|jgi:prepilin-type N-terminal cleavage/methylation domain-containing protein|nr:prepilin-type N-terminal cleavage/methylation domain-containing protein [Candidatus Limnocylindria bacterium]
MKFLSSTIEARTHRRGFTLVELMVVLAIMGIMTAMIIPEMKGSYEDAMLRSGSRELMNAFTLAYSRAVSLNQTHRVHLNRTSGHYQVEKAGQGMGPGGGYEPVNDFSGASGNIDKRIAVEIRSGGGTGPSPGPGGATSPMNATPFSTPTDVVAFYGDGTADGVEVLLRDRQGFHVSLRVNPITARIKVSELERQ